MFADTKIAQEILRKRYYADKETEPEHLLARVAKHIASVEDSDEWEQKFYSVMAEGKFLPNSPCLVNAGRGGGLFACFVLGMEDYMESIIKAKGDALMITKAGGGWGIHLGKLRPEGSHVKGSTHGIAGGPVGFWKTFSYDMLTMTQGGFRDAACMATLDVDHPDIRKFISAKSATNSVVELLNLRRITDSKEDAESLAGAIIENDSNIATAAETYLSNFNMSVLVTDNFMEAAISDRDIILSHPEYESAVKEDASIILHEIASGAHANGEPGILFIDRIRERTRYDPQLINATNPCGEQPLPPNGSCCLGSINLSEYVVNKYIDFDDLKDTIYTAVRFLDNMITLNEFPTPETKEWSHFHRSIGLGIMGWADMLTKMDIEYGSEDAIKLAHRIGGFIRYHAERASEELGSEKGHDIWDGRRNHALLSIAPTGTISLLAGCSPGIELPFSDETVRVDNTGTHIIKHPLADMPAFMKVGDADPRSLIDTVAVFSEYIDTSISYTVNLPSDASIGDVRNAIIYAWEKKCNGITLYVDGSRQRQVLNYKKPRGSAATKRPPVMDGKTFKYTGIIEGEGTNLYVTVNSLNGSPWEVFVHTPYIKSMPELQMVTAVTRLTSLALRNGANITDIIKQLRRVEGQMVSSVPAIIARALAQYVEGEESGTCPECDNVLRYVGGCNVCETCGYSNCG